MNYSWFYSSLGILLNDILDDIVTNITRDVDNTIQNMMGLLFLLRLFIFKKKNTNNNVVSYQKLDKVTEIYRLFSGSAL